jgi:hypothetical protein
MSRTKFLNEAFSLLEEAEDEDIIVDDELEIEPIDDDIEDFENESNEEIEEETTLDELEDRVEKLEDAVFNTDVVPEVEEEIDERTPQEKARDKFHKDIEEHFRKLSHLPADVEITEEFLDKPINKKAHIPHVATRHWTTSDNVRNVLLGK